MLISAIMPIMSGFSGHVINLPRDVVSFAHDLPRLPSELDVLVVRKEQGQSHHDFRVRRAVVQEALQWLLENKYDTTYSSFLFCTCLLYMWLHCLRMHAQTTSLHYPQCSINYCLHRLAPQCFAFRNRMEFQLDTSRILGNSPLGQLSNCRC